MKKTFVPSKKEAREAQEANRRQIATACIQALLANPTKSYSTKEHLSQAAVIYADALIKALSEESK